MSEPNSLTPADEQNYTTLYFGYASNLSPRTLQQRCPGALYIGLALLRQYKFIISQLGFGNIIPSSPQDSDLVYGALFFLTAQHSSALDGSEEIPNWHIKRTVTVHMLGEEGREVEATTYIDVNNQTPGVISKEYVMWMRKAIAEGLEMGVPRGYFEKYMDGFLPSGYVGREEKVVMVRTIKVDKEDLRYVPGDVKKMMGGGEAGGSR